MNTMIHANTIAVSAAMYERIKAKEFGDDFTYGGIPYRRHLDNEQGAEALQLNKIGGVAVGVIITFKEQKK